MENNCMNNQITQSSQSKPQIDYSRIYSPTKLAMFDQCPKEYEFSYIDPIHSKLKNKLKKLTHNIWFFNTLGKAVHNAITLFYYLPVNERDEKQLKENLKISWLSEAMWNKKPPLGKWGGFKSLDEEREIYGQALLMLKNFLRIAEINPRIKFLPTKDFRKSIEDYNNLITRISDYFDISGKFDLITENQEGSLNIIDFKTGKNEKTDPFQLKFYKLLAELNFKRPIKSADFYFLKTGEKKKIEVNDITGEEIIEILKDKINKIKGTREFTAKPSKLCKYCLFKLYCPEKTEVSKIIEDITDDYYPDDLPF